MPSGTVQIDNPGFSITGERIHFCDGFALSHGQLHAYSDLEFEGMSPDDTDFQLYAHIGGKSQFQSNDFTPFNYEDAEVSLFRPRENPGGISKIKSKEKIHCFELHFSIEKLIEWFDRDPPKKLRPLLKPDINIGLGLPLPLLNSYHHMAQLLDNNPFSGSLWKMSLEGSALQMVANYFAYLSDEKARDWPDIISREQRLAMVARELLLANLRSPPSVNELACEVGIAPRRLNIIFNEVFGKSIFQTLTNARLEYARTELFAGHSSIKEIAYSCGYNHVSNFSTAFKSKYGMSPAQVFPNIDQFSPPDIEGSRYLDDHGS